jgi:pantetheine-phosphate adenylyltransferase
MSAKSVIAIYPGTFDPFTLGHADIAIRGAALFDKLIVAVSQSGRTTMFTPQERLSMVQAELKSVSNIEVVSFGGLLVDVCAQHGATAVLRGIRSFADFEYESEMASLNRQMSAKVDTVFLSTTDALRSISGSRVREISKLNGKYQGFVSAAVAAQIVTKLKA